MKKSLIIIGMIIIIGIGVIMMVLLKPKKEINSIKSLEYRESDGRSMYGALEYTYHCGKDCTLTTKPQGVKDEDALKVEVTKEEQEELLELVKKYKVASWDGFKGSDKYVLDGSSFTLSIKTKDDVTIYASGYMKYPRNFHNFMKELEELFARINRKKLFIIFDHEKYKDFKIENVSKLVITKETEGGLDTEEIIEKEEIEKKYDYWKHIVIGPKCSMACEDNTTIYKFIMNDGKEYTIEKECDWVIIDKERYYYQYRKDV